MVSDYMYTTTQSLTVNIVHTTTTMLNLDVTFNYTYRLQIHKNYERTL